ncbi:MAG TPA: type IV pilus secretin PilQ, partial [Kofleriaceae bacterium]|nr:type IV pilus secretin PilQ [Kofleriaceae bacterium]
ARHEAARWRQRAKEAQASGASQATAIARRAEAAAREAKDREAQAKAAAAVARTQHSEAAAATKVAEARRARAEAAAKVAEARRARAEAAARQAEASRQAAEAKAAKAENLAQKHALSAVARGVAIAHQHMLDAARRARRDAVAVARRAEAKADAHRAEAKKLASRVARAEAELADLHDETASARARRRREAKKLAQIAARAKTARADIARAATARSEAEAARAKADERLAQAENIRTAAETARTRAETELSRARKARILAETKLEKAEELTAKAEAAVKAAAARAKAAAAHKPSAHLAAVRDIAFVDKDGISRVVISLSRPAEAHVVSAKGKRLILDIDGARIPDRLERTLDTHEMGGAVVAVSSYRDAKKPGRVRVVVDLDEPVSQRLKKVGTSYYWDFSDPAPKTFARRGPQQNRSPKPEPSAGEPASTVVAPFRAAPRAAIYSRVSPMRSCHYRDRIIDLDFKDADIHNLMRLLTDVGGLSIIIPDDVKATVTVRLRRVSWVEAMEVILASKGLWYECKGNLIRVAPRKQLEAEHQAELDRLRALAEAEAPETEVITLNYAVAQDLQPQLVPLLSPKGRIEIDDRTNSLIINDIAAHRRRIIQLVQRLDYQTPQIQIEARIVEARSTYSREIGIQWGGNFSADVSDGLVFDGAGGADDDQTNSTGVSAVPPNFGVNLPAAVGTGSGGALGLSLGALDGAFNVNLRLSALEDQGTVRIVSAPKITVLNNVKAEISDGVSIPISVISANGVQTQFVPADLSLKVTPHVSQGDCSIAMNIEVTKNQPDFANTGARGDPTILRKEARTTILVSDGSTAVIGGVYTRNTGSSYSKVPFFGDIPVLGWLFKSKVQNDDRTEVLIFITPKITNRAFLRCQT